MPNFTHVYFGFATGVKPNIFPWFCHEVKKKLSMSEGTLQAMRASFIPEPIRTRIGMDEVAVIAIGTASSG
jgi:hypothetical protein